MISAAEALQKLKDGNQRYLANESALPTSHDQQRNALVAGQAPYAIVLGCSDSRVPTELIFDQGLGDIFVIRVAGNIATPTQIGSIEYAAEQFGTPLIIVLGHSHCGAVKATLAQVQNPGDIGSPNLAAIVEKIQPAVAPLCSHNHDSDETLEQNAIRANVDASVAQLTADSAVLAKRVENGELNIVGAQYFLESGIVEFFD